MDIKCKIRFLNVNLRPASCYLSLEWSLFQKLSGIGSKTLKRAIKNALALGWISPQGQGFRLNIAKQWITTGLSCYPNELYEKFYRVSHYKEFLEFSQSSAKTAPRGHGKRSDDRSRKRQRINYRHLMTAGLRLEFLSGSNSLATGLSKNRKIGLRQIANESLSWLKIALKGKITKQALDYETIEVFEHLRNLHPDLIDLKRTKSILRLIRKSIRSGYSVEAIKIELNRTSLPNQIKSPFGYACYLLKPLIRNRFSKPILITQSPPVDKQVFLAGLGSARQALKKNCL